MARPTWPTTATFAAARPKTSARTRGTAKQRARKRAASRARSSVSGAARTIDVRRARQPRARHAIVGALGVLLSTACGSDERPHGVIDDFGGDASLGAGGAHGIPEDAALEGASDGDASNANPV